MPQIALLRSDGNAEKCPLTNCFKCLNARQEAFAGYSEVSLAGVFSISPHQEETIRKAKILKSKGAEAIHVVTCAFAHKIGTDWVLGDGLEENLHSLMENIAAQTGLPCVLGTAHLPRGYEPRRF